MGIKLCVITRYVAAGAIIVATTFAGADARANTSRPALRHAAVSRVDVREIVFDFGDRLGELHDALSYDEEDRDAARVDRACAGVVAAYPQLRDAVGDKGMELLVAAESMVDACRRHFAATLDADGFEIVDGDYYTYRELSFDFAD